MASEASSIHEQLAGALRDASVSPESGLGALIASAAAALRDAEVERARLTAALDAARGEAAGHGQTAGALRESERLFRSLAENVPAATFIYQGTHFRFVNSAALHLTGYTREELMRMTFWDLVHPDDRETVRSRGMARQRGEPVQPRYQFRLVRADGAVRWVDFSAGAVTFNGKAAALGSAFDVTASRQASEALERQASVFANLYDAVIISDPDGRIIEWNPAAERTYGYTRAEALGRDARLWMGEVEGARIEREIFEALEREGRWSGEIHFTRRDGTSGVVETVVVPLRDAGGRRRGALGVNRDVTERVHERRALAETQARYRALFERARDAIYMADADGVLVDANPALRELLGTGEADPGVLHARELFAVPAESERLLAQLAALGSVRDLEARVRRRDGTLATVLVSAAVRRGADGAPHGHQAILHDITERKRAEERLAHDALHDALTGLPNRALFIDRLEHASSRCRRTRDALFAVLFVDLDRFKLVNDSLGHGAGDALLRAAAERLTGAVRVGDTVARFGGDEFTLLLEDLRGPEEADEVAARVLTAVARPFSLGRREVITTTSVGIALSSSGFADPDELLRNADAALHRAKALGKARFEVFDRAMHAEALQRLRLETDLRHATERDEFRLAYQPVVDLASGRLAGFEALARWTHAERGDVPPGEFIPIAEETGLIVPFGRWAVREASRQLARWQGAHAADRGIRLSVNVSGRQLAEPGVLALLRDTLAETGVQPGTLALELTESVLLAQGTEAGAQLAGIRALGVAVYLDDFGTGYSSLSYLQRFRIDALKLDRSFITRLGVDEASGALVEAVIAMARSLGVAVIAEGVETAPQRERLRALGCPLAQGNLFSAPLDGAAAGALLARDPRW